MWRLLGEKLLMPTGGLTKIPDDDFEPIRGETEPLQLVGAGVHLRQS
jgi:hypothetical protein